MPSAAAEACVCFSKLYFKKNSQKMTGQRGRKKIIQAGRKSHTRLNHTPENSLALEDCSGKKYRPKVQLVFSLKGCKAEIFFWRIQYQELRFMETNSFVLVSTDIDSIDGNVFFDLCATEKLLHRVYSKPLIWLYLYWTSAIYLWMNHNLEFFFTREKLL